MFSSGHGLRLKGLARLGIDVGVLSAAVVLGVVLRHEFAPPPATIQILPFRTLLVVGLQMAALYASGVLRGSWRFTGLRDALDIVGATSVVAVLLALLRLLAPGTAIALPYGAILINAVLAVAGLMAVRLARRLQAEAADATHRREHARVDRRAVIVGAGRTGVRIAEALSAHRASGYTVMGFVDDDPSVQGHRINGVKVLGATGDLATIAGHHGVRVAVLAPETPSGGVIRQLRERCTEAGLDTRLVPSVYDLVDGAVELSTVRSVAIEDLLRRPTVDINTSSIETLVRGKVVAVTGAGGSIGAELCRQLARFGPAKLLLIERSEPALWSIEQELLLDGVPLTPYVADVTDAHRIGEILGTESPAVVFHAAAHKHVPLMEQNPHEAIKNNVFGTQTVADLSITHAVGTFVFISTDKAVNPSSVMGATKRLAERYVNQLASSSCRFVSVRFGNVLGSTGSVVPTFQEQIARGGPVTVTHPEVRRYFMTIPEASQLVLQAATLGKGGETFVLEMGDPIKIADLAEDLIRLSGFEPHRDIAITFTGLRPGEKLFEELSFDDEQVEPTEHPKIWRHRDGLPTWDTVITDLAALRAVMDDDARSAVPELTRLVPEATLSHGLHTNGSGPDHLADVRPR